MTDAEYIATLEQALQKKTLEWQASEERWRETLATMHENWRHAYAAYARCANLLEKFNANVSIEETPVIACYIGYGYCSKPKNVYAFSCRADAEEYLLSLWEEDEYYAFCLTLDELGAENMERIFDLMCDNCEEDFECWFIFEIKHNFM